MLLIDNLSFKFFISFCSGLYPFVEGLIASFYISACLSWSLTINNIWCAVFFNHALGVILCYGSAHVISHHLVSGLIAWFSLRYLTVLYGFKSSARRTTNTKFIALEISKLFRLINCANGSLIFEAHCEMGGSLVFFENLLLLPCHTGEVATLRIFGTSIHLAHLLGSSIIVLASLCPKVKMMTFQIILDLLVLTSRWFLIFWRI